MGTNEGCVVYNAFESLKVLFPNNIVSLNNKALNMLLNHTLKIYNGFMVCNGVCDQRS